MGTMALGIFTTANTQPSGHAVTTCGVRIKLMGFSFVGRLLNLFPSACLAVLPSSFPFS